LTEGVPRCGMLLPLLTADKELPFDLDGHGPPPFSSWVEYSKGDRLLTTWLSPGQMSHP
jgi:hypothetical protein